MCTAISTLTTHICGLWGYEKVVPSMSRWTLEKLLPAQCDMIVKHGTFKTVQGRTISGITTPEYTMAQFNMRGWDGILDGDAACLGVKLFKKDTGEEGDRTVESLFMKFTVRTRQNQSGPQEQSLRRGGHGGEASL